LGLAGAPLGHRDSARGAPPRSPISAWRGSLGPLTLHFEAGGIRHAKARPRVAGWSLRGAHWGPPLGIRPGGALVGAITTGDLSWEELASRRGFMERKKEKGARERGSGGGVAGNCCKVIIVWGPTHVWGGGGVVTLREVDDREREKSRSNVTSTFFLRICNFNIAGMRVYMYAIKKIGLDLYVTRKFARTSMPYCYHLELLWPLRHSVYFSNQRRQMEERKDHFTLRWGLFVSHLLLPLSLSSSIL
jgi:hypothetical protein